MKTKPESSFYLSRRLLHAVFTLLPVISFSQDYIIYQRNCNEAELAIINEDHKTATAIYNDILDKYEFVFALDCYKAAQTAVLAKDTSTAFRFLEKGFLQGIRKDDIVTSPIISNLSKSGKWTKLLTDYDSLHTIHLSNINQTLRQRIIPIYEKEQHYNEIHDYANFLRYFPTLWKYKRINRQCTDSMLAIINEIGHFPGEREIGISSTEMYVFDSISDKFHRGHKGTPYVSTHEYMIFVHYYQLGGKYNYDTLFLNSMKAGYIRSHQLAQISDEQVSKNYRDYYSPVWKMYRCLNKKAITVEEKERLVSILNLNRSKIGLRTIEDQEIIEKWRMKLREERRKGFFDNIHIE